MKAGMLAWLARQPRWYFHFTPTSASWLDAVENFFSKITCQRIRGGGPFDHRPTLRPPSTPI